MPIGLTFDFSTPADYVFDSNKIEVVGGKAKLKLSPLTIITNNSDFGTTSQYVYDMGQVVFSSGKARIKDNADPNIRAFASYTSNKDFNYGTGDLTGTLVSDATVSGGFLNCPTTANPASYCKYNNNGKLSLNQSNACYRFYLKFNSTGGTKPIFCFSQGISDSRGLYYLYLNGGKIKLDWRLSVSNPTITTTDLFNFSPVVGQLYEIEINMDYLYVYTWMYTCFIDGILVSGPTSISHNGTAWDTPNLIWLGGEYTQSVKSDIAIAQVTLFNIDTHTAGYSPSPINQPESKFITTAQSIEMNTNILDETSNPNGVNSMVLVSSIEIASGGDTIKYNVSIDNGVTWLWFNGSSWVGSSGFSESNTIAEVNTNRNTIGVPTTDILRFRTWLKSNNGTTTPEIDNIQVQHNSLSFAVDNPTINNAAVFFAEGLSNFVDTILASGSDTIKYQIEVNGIKKYWNGSAWIAASGYAQTNDAATILANVTTLLTIGIGQSIKFFAFLHSQNGLTTPELDSLFLEYNQFIPPTPPPNTCNVFGNIIDIFGFNMEGVDVIVEAVGSPSELDSGASIVLPAIMSTTTNDIGIFEIDLIQSSLYNPDSQYKFTFKKRDLSKEFIVSIPVQESVDFLTLI